MDEYKKEFPPYRVVYQEGNGAYEEKKSRFIASIAPASSEEEAVSFIESIRKKYYDARHHCTAFIIGRNKELTRCSDDGEPSGTAGKPILEVLLGADVTNVVAVVTRYFGGTLLGTGGLVRAYTQAAREGIENAGIGIMRYKTEMTIEIDYTDVGKVQYLLGSRKIDISQSRYTDKVEFDIRISNEEKGEVSKALTEATAARAKINVIGAGYDMDIEKSDHKQ
ncbi:MAG: YigZ family protein [Lachnospiraceae bacterium]|nr:YigZ family protein [Lachnospiraceae bacterium]MDE6184402.1 YigZ family protein [Lachnospiraceae bacterium]